MENNLNDIKIVKVNISLNEKTKIWYQYKAKSMAMDMSQLMGYVLSNWCEQQQNSEAVRTMSNITANTDTKALSSENKEMANLFFSGIERLEKLANSGKLSMIAEAMENSEKQEN